MRPKILLTAASGAAGFALIGCGDGDGGEKTVVQTVIREQPARTVTAPAPAAPATTPDSTTGTATTPAPPQATQPVAGLPSGAVAIQGRFVMRVLSEDDDFLNPRGEREDEERQWFASMTCRQSRCSVRLRRQLGPGGYETLTLKQGATPRSYGATTKVNARYCYSENLARRPATKRISLRASGVAQRNGQPTATRLDGYFTVRQECGTLSGKLNVMYRGSLG